MLSASADSSLLAQNHHRKIRYVGRFDCGGGLGLISHWASCLRMFLFHLVYLNRLSPDGTISYDHKSELFSYLGAFHQFFHSAGEKYTMFLEESIQMYWFFFSFVPSGLRNVVRSQGKPPVIFSSCMNITSPSIQLLPLSCNVPLIKSKSPSLLHSYQNC
jgi:hypothetical protein